MSGRIPASWCVVDDAGVVHQRSTNTIGVVCCGEEIAFDVDRVVNGGSAVCTCLPCLACVLAKGIPNER